MWKHLVIYFVFHILLKTQGAGTESDFPGRNKFVKVLNAQFPSTIKKEPKTLTISECANECLKVLTCYSFAINESISRCLLYPTWTGKVRLISASDYNYYQKIRSVKCPVNVIYGGMLPSAENIPEPEPKTYFFCMKACKDNASCYSTNYDTDTSTCYLSHRTSRSAIITLQPNNWIYTEIDRYRFDNEMEVLVNMNKNGCHVKFLFHLSMIGERSALSSDSMKRSARFKGQQNTFGDIMMITFKFVDGRMACAIKCMETLGCVGFRYYSDCEIALKY
ncbi:uncharacterized protein LOC106868213 isoform X1 [Octopus bimaculoides]|uniref:uncharacterized protein LOC106868213 isoform X1 n=1 Tax=Octopus bimaculoides TaxID=37653 RepID=UPI00071D16C6|nr:uncharacterized protein LOC106868213 isoform X1 [Octopus bimaculoides]|eukprot:XP_014768862.1 PREDICTED: uncharacterized protein LOC106868213 isoform X1 [Octopus bimaculoides]